MFADSDDGNLDALIRSYSCHSHPHETLETCSILKRGGPADRTREKKPMQSRSATGFEIWLTPHRPRSRP